jgi:hypothetical protein
VSLIDQYPKYSDENYEASYNIYKFELIRKFEIIDTDLNVLLEMPLDRRKVVLTTNNLKQFLHVKPIHILEISYQASKNQISKNMF